MIIEAWHPIWGGGQSHVFELSKKLISNHGCKIDVFVMNLQDENGNIQKNIEEFEDGNLRIIRTGKARNFNSFTDRLSWIFEVVSEVKSNHKKEKYSLIHAHANLPGIPGKILRDQLKIPVIYTIHGNGANSMVDMYGKNLKSLILSIIENFLHTKIKYDAEISVDRLTSEKPNKNKRISVISNGVDIEKFENVNIAKDSTKIKFIFVGRLHKQKGLDYLLTAVSKIKNELPINAEFHIIGSGELEKHLMQKCIDLDIKNLFKFRGKIYNADLIREYKSSNIFILPSLYEGQPLTLLEAWAARLPVIATDVGDNKYFVKNEINGYLVPAKNITALSKAILKSLNNVYIQTMGENGFDFVKNNHTWDIVAKQTYEIYSKTLQ